MKKSLTFLLTVFMFFSLVGCNSKNEEPTIEKQEPQQEVVVEEVNENNNESTIEETIVNNDSDHKDQVVDYTKLDYWVITLDQNGNELERYTAPYGTTVTCSYTGEQKVVKGNTKFYVTINSKPKKIGISMEEAKEVFGDNVEVVGDHIEIMPIGGPICGEVINIPAYINGYPVTKIGSVIFDSNGKDLTIGMPKTIDDWSGPVACDANEPRINVTIKYEGTIDDFINIVLPASSWEENGLQGFRSSWEIGNMPRIICKDGEVVNVHLNKNEYSLDSVVCKKNSKMNKPVLIYDNADDNYNEFFAYKWYADKELQNEFDFNTQITSNIDIYPKYVCIGDRDSDEDLIIVTNIGADAGKTVSYDLYLYDESIHGFVKSESKQIRLGNQTDETPNSFLGMLEGDISADEVYVGVKIHKYNMGGSICDHEHIISSGE